MNEEGSSSGTREAVDASRHVVVCVGTDDPSARLGHAHVIRVETDSGVRRRWSIVELVAAFRRGERFVLDGDVELAPAVCPRCPMVTVTSSPREALAATPACRDR